MVSFRKIFPIFFKEAPDGTFHWFFVKWCTLESTSNHERCYSFKLNKIFLWEVDVEGLMNRQVSKHDHESHQLCKEIDKLNHAIDIKEEERRWLSGIKTDVDVECNKISGKLERVLGEKLELEKELSSACTEIAGKSKSIENILIDNAASEKRLREEIEEKEIVIGDLKEIIHQDRIKYRKQQIEDLQSHNENVEKLRKEIEMLDKDFVDVAKAMRLYRQDKDRPVKGFRISK